MSDADGALWSLAAANGEPEMLIDLAVLAGVLDAVVDHAPRSPSALAALTVRSVNTGEGWMVITTWGRTVRVSFDPPAAKVVGAPPQAADRPRLVRKARRTGSRDRFEAKSRTGAVTPGRLLFSGG